MIAASLDPQLQSVTEWLGCYVPDGQVCEVRALEVQGARARSFVSASREDLARQAVEWDRAGAKGTYFTLNPLRPDLVGGRASARKADVIRRIRLPIDIDPIRPPDCASTEEERAAAWRVADCVRGTLDGAGFVAPVVGDSGNGFHLGYPILLPNDDASQDLVKAVLNGLNQRCGSEQAQVDTRTFDAPRIWKMPGTKARKGPNTKERPHRYSWLVEGRPWDEAAAQRNTALLSRLLEMWAYVDDVRKGRPDGDLIARARAYIAKEPPAISGQRGHDRTYHVCCVLVKDFGLDQAQAWEAIQGWNATCQPPWSEPDLRRKLAEAAKAPGPNGKLLGGTNGTHHADGAAAGASPGPEERTGPSAFPAPIPASQLQVPAQQPWLWKGYLARGAVTLFSALWKAGKTTLLTHLVKEMERGGTFCGQDLDPASVLYITEENEGRWAGRRDKHGLTDHIDFLIRPFGQKPDWKRWMEFLGWLKELQARKRYDLIVFDTLANLWPVKDENDACQVQGALMPLHAAIDLAALLLVHHQRKSDGGEATSSRGSGSLTAFVDTIMEFRRFAQDDRDDRRRVLTSYGRDEETPAEIVVELTETGYVVQGAGKQSVQSKALADLILPLLPASPPGLSFTNIREQWPEGVKPQKDALYRALLEGTEVGLWQRSGGGVKGDPHLYSKHGVPATGGIDVSAETMFP